MPEDLQHLVELVAERIRAFPAAAAPRRVQRPLPTNPREIAPFIDHTLLRADATAAEVETLCAEAARHGFATVCVNGSQVERAARALAGSEVKPIAVVGFPLGAMTPEAKAFETADAVRRGAREIDMVVHVGALKSRDYATVHRDIAAVVAAARPWPVKVILETSLLDDEQKLLACALSKAAGAAFVKTSTGFGGGGATEADVALLRRAVGDDLGVKASGGVRTAEDAMRMLRAGADRIGASASVAIVEGTLPEGGGY
ncbi:deoxyribose-phosphate aldolase [Vulgatibacter sp.]|uniref:deoxyribose-phosphate aldolase n=1 Tax=Vulgatibacter sp. TaxID=1971226 RepID=UPI003568BDBE